eukprot:jgi/Mesvir1/8470/Mv04349-RA.1
MVRRWVLKQYSSFSFCQYNRAAMTRTLVFVDLDQCSKEAARINPFACRIVAYCGRGYNGPIPLGVLMRSPSLSREAADSLFQYDLGKRVQSGDVRPGDRVVIVSKDASWYNADPHLKADGVNDVLVCSNVHDLPHDIVTDSRPLEREGMPKTEKAFYNFVMNNVAPTRGTSSAALTCQKNETYY